MWVCSLEGIPTLTWASPSDQSGKYGLTRVSCTEVTFSGGRAQPWTLIRALQKIGDILKSLEP